MAYTAPTVEDFKARFVSFGPLGDPNDLQVQAALEDAETVADATWSDADRRQAVMLKAAHELTMNGVGTGAEAKLAASGAMGFTSFSSGGLSLTRASTAVSSSASDPNGYGQTAYGRRLQALIRVRFVGIMVV